jgi:hypothetical protein
MALFVLTIVAMMTMMEVVMTMADRINLKKIPFYIKNPRHKPWVLHFV